MQARAGRPVADCFEFEKLDVYYAAADFYDLARKIIRALPRDYLFERDQLRRAALSILLNVCEGAGEFSPSEKARFYRMAVRSASECGGLIRLFERDLGEKPYLEDAAGLLIRIISMLTKLVHSRTRG